jgi:hypothetical protein
MFAATSAALPSSAFPAFASSRFTGRKLGVRGIMRWNGCRERVSRGGWRNFALFSSFVAMVVLVAMAVTMRSFVMMMRRYSASLGRGGSGSGDGRRGHIPDIVFLDVRIVHTSVKFSKVTIVTLNKIVGVLHGHSHHGSSVGEGSNKSESRASGRHVY